MASKFETFIKFSTDSVGLERTFRLLQATVQIFSSYTLPFDLLLFTLSLWATSIPSSSGIRSTLGLLNQRLGLARRYLRLFRFLESFNAAQKLYSQLSSAPSSPQEKSAIAKITPWLDVFAKTFNGMYFLLEASTLPHALQIPGLSVWGLERERVVAIEAQRFWLFALVCGLLHNLLQIPLAVSSAPPPVGSASTTTSEKQDSQTEAEKKDSENVSEKGPTDDMNGPEFREWTRNRVKEVKERTRLRRRQILTKVRKLGRGAATNALDILIPGTFVGWINVEPGTVSVAMFVTTILTSMDVWERCGREVAGN
ncbi:peroxisomal biogenesis factor 11 [Hypoxylon trugodes]|uniref:peroxisomal biogenesis factor 11 n=1 Tax=Hypoxylon trugodes TaxID=326681 RepID=UPI00218EAF51|nr:peroxisomal biogenesis factor 11 [Hypoxylon trugodes]KAI1387529.1 peroxisomal biogenesis factor 11 [Hypoxylon trugodes]